MKKSALIVSLIAMLSATSGCVYLTPEETIDPATGAVVPVAPVVRTPAREPRGGGGGGGWGG